MSGAGQPKAAWDILKIRPAIVPKPDTEPDNAPNKLELLRNLK